MIDLLLAVWLAVLTVLGVLAYRRLDKEEWRRDHIHRDHDPVRARTLTDDDVKRLRNG